jgi:hypothetical protein
MGGNQMVVAIAARTAKGNVVKAPKILTIINSCDI